MSNIWKLPAKIDQSILETFPELDPIVAQLLYNRGLTNQEEIDEFLHPDYSQDIHDPFLFKDMTKACQRIYQAIKDKQLITVFGDYDADGVGAAVILTTVLEKLGAKVEAYLPHREKEGYGLNKQAIEELAKTSTNLLITCDCGVSNEKEVALANQKNIDVIITDHHAIPQKLPKALAIIHPKIEKEVYPCKNLAGGGVAFKLAQGLLKKSDLPQEEKEKTEKWLLDLVAISTVADMVPLLEENRTLVKYGLIVLQKTQRLGLQKMIEVALIDPQKIDAITIGFGIAPRINAAGRMDHANLAYYLLKETDSKKAEKLANDLNTSNLERQRLTEQTFRQAKTKKIDLKQKLLFFYQADWPAGLTGLVAGKMQREHNRPCVVLTDIDDDNIVGSGRSIKDFDITAALQGNSDLLERFGGHPQAGGFAIKKENLDSFISKMQNLANEQLSDEQLQPTLNIELVIDFTEINWGLVDILEKFQPFGQKNAQPLFLSQGVLITAARKVGKDQNHWKLGLAKQDKKLGAIAFGLGQRDLTIGQRVDIVYNLSINQWNGNREIQLIVKDIKEHETS